MTGGAEVKLTKGTDYGLRGILYLARQPQGKIALVTDIARSEGVPESYLAKIFQDLARGGVLVSHRGAKGGFSLVRSLKEVSLLEVIEAIEGPIALQPCLDHRQGCEHIAECGVSDVIRKAQSEMVRVLESTSLENLLEQTLAKATISK
jgi:Rrf2 family transcriptional regulator, iron-sulfur cluster assembly transcription factor